MFAWLRVPEPRGPKPSPAGTTSVRIREKPRQWQPPATSRDGKETSLSEAGLADDDTARHSGIAVMISKQDAAIG